MTAFRNLTKLIILAFCFPVCQSFSLKPPRISAKLNRIQSAILTLDDHADSTSLPLEAFLASDSFSSDLTLLYASDFVPKQEISPLSAYCKYTKSRHEDCMELFDGYATETLRCDALDDKSLNVRWRASWIPAGSTWLYNLADVVGWEIERKIPDYSTISTFSWRSVFGVFAQAFRTGTIPLPISSVEGNTVVTVVEESTNESDICRISLKERIDLAQEADAGRLQNRRVAQELAAWLDVSRRPDECGILPETWEGVVRERTIAGVPGAGALDVDPNEEDGEGELALVLFGGLCLAGLALSFNFLLADEVVSGTGSVSAQCEDAARIEFGSGYLSECFGPYGDGPFVR